jgi:hypothetical protein
MKRLAVTAFTAGVSFVQLCLAVPADARQWHSSIAFESLGVMALFSVAPSSVAVTLVQPLTKRAPVWVRAALTTLVLVPFWAYGSFQLFGYYVAAWCTYTTREACWEVSLRALHQWPLSLSIAFLGTIAIMHFPRRRELHHR